MRRGTLVAVATIDVAAVLRCGGRTLSLERPLVMGIVNASPDSFSDGARDADLDAQTATALRLLDEGADLLDVGGQSAITNVAEIDTDTEIARVVPLIAAIRSERPDAVISADTYRPAVVSAALDAGASIVNDVSALRYPKIADRCAERGAALVVMHTRARPKQRLQDPGLYDDVAGDVVDLLGDRLAEARRRGMDDEALIVDPGIDFAKTPYQSVVLLRQLDRVRALGRPLLLALSRKDFVGALTHRPPADRGAGTLAAIGYVGTGPGLIYRVHDVAATVDYLRVLAALEARTDVEATLALPDHLRHQRRP